MLQSMKAAGDRAEVGGGGGGGCLSLTLFFFWNFFCKVGAVWGLGFRVQGDAFLLLLFFGNFRCCYGLPSLPHTPNPKPQALNPKALSPKPQTPNPKP